MPNALTNMTDTIIGQAALESFTATIAPFNLFSTDCSPAPVQKGDKVKVALVGASDAAQDFTGTYTMQDSDAEGLDVSIDKHKFVSYSLSDKEVADKPQVKLEMFGRQKGFQLAKAVMQDVLTLVTAENYGAASFTGAASTFDADDVADLGAVCDAADWPEFARGLVLSPTYWAALLKDAGIQAADAFGGAEAIRQGMIPGLMGFDMYKSSLIPANSWNLVGFCVNPQAILFANRYLEPASKEAATRAGLEFAPLTGEGGVTLGFREWYDNDSGTVKRVLECNYGYLKGLGTAIKSMVSA